MTLMTKNGRASGSFGAETINKGKTDKIARYGWTIRDTPGRFQMIDKGMLEVDDTYQRPENAGKVKAISSSWSWIACGVISVAHRDGRFMVMDGNHRVCAARNRSDITVLPCFVFDTTDVAVEAKGFLQANTLRKPVTAIEKFKAQVLIGDPEAVMVNDLASGTGHKLSEYNASGRYVRCVALMMRLAKADPETLRAIWPLVVECSGENAVYERVVDSLFYIERRLKAVNPDNSLLRNPWRARVLALGSEGILAAAARAAAFYAKGGASVWARGVVEALNKNVRHRLILDKSEGA